MPGGIANDLEEMEHFLATLRRFDDELAESVSNLQTHWAELGQEWRDAKYQQFAADWEEALTAIQGYLQDAPGNTAFLRQKADALADYLA